jgi:four helix bundle protein
MAIPRSKGNQLEKRFIAFASTIVGLSESLPKTPQGRHVCAQLLRSGTAAAANYAEARGAESRADFIHKLKVVFKELSETTVWLEIVAQGSWLSPSRIAEVIEENRELCRIIAASISTARGREEE